MNNKISRRVVIAAGAAGLAAAALPLRAQAPLKAIFGYTAVTDFATVFIAREEGYFTKHGLDIEPKLIPLNPSIPPAIQSDSIQLGGPTPSVFLQAVDGGLDQVVLTGGGATSKKMTGIGLVARAGAGIKTAQDCAGKKIGVPGLGAFLHVGFRAWLKSQGVDYNKVNFIEAAFPQHGDLLRGGSLDAVVTADPFMARIVGSGIGYVASYYSTFLPDGLPSLVFVARRDWVQKNPAAAKGFQAAIGEAARFLNDPKNSAKVREHIGKYIKLPPDVLATVQISPPLPVVTEPVLGWWADQMVEQKLLKAKPALANLIVK
ncbi:ABC transporter substrate-binding protein [Ramlibacter sp. XY19]|uniref:ABC transporter substrate-binding protein n=1 Tax=Ramlibacter paludis TaxID=2908000 RepID=UPI0023DA172F|nr:ABC transporter substrate-binding protein [Ramlibacter paludis]MCG2592420.1 ABC transporter substrate-binding protein [Ramlibacter paludis]